MLDISGRQYGRWTVLGPAPKRGKHIMWSCRCACGSEKQVLGFSLKSGKSSDCGCERLKATRIRSTKHGMHLHPAYSSWRAMLCRCTVPKTPGWQLYGGRGISVTIAWYSFEGFWADMGPTWEAGKTLDRINVDGNYGPDNCRWATPQQQANNRRSNKIIPTPKGPMNVMEAAKEYGIPFQTIFSRIRYGWPEADLLKPVRKKNT